MRGRYSMLGFDPDLLFRAEGDSAEIARAPDLAALRALPRRHARRAPRADRRKPHRRAAGPAADVGRRLRLPRLRHGAADGGAAAARSRRRSRVPDAILIRPRIVAIFDAVKDELTVVTPVRPEPGVSRARRLRPRRRPADRRGRRARPAARPCRRARRHRAERRGRLEHDAGRIQGDGGAREGLHRRRRHLSGGAVAALRGALPASRLLALPGAPPREPLALPLFPRFRRLFASSARARRSWCACATAR